MIRGDPAAKEVAHIKLDGKFNGTLAVCKIDKKDTLNIFACPAGSLASGTYAEQLGSKQAKGAELEINARPMKEL